MESAITDIIIYPIKSLGGIHLKSGYAEGEGLKHDRRLMLVDEKGRFLSQREIPKMATIRTSLDGNNLVVSSKDGSQLSLSLDDNSVNELQVQIWKDQLTAHHMKLEYDSWFSNTLGREVKLVRLQESSRKADHKYSHKNESVSFADGYPYLLTNEESLNHLNDKLEKPVPMNRFRPNIVVKHDQAFAEDNFTNFSLGTAQFYLAKRSARCNVITIDQETANSGKEPLTTLSSFRKESGKVYFGANLHCSKPGIIKVGDQIITNK